MGIKPRAGECASAGCERQASQRDISLTGVVVKTERLASHPERPLGGQVRAGNYMEATPAVYVE